MGATAIAEQTDEEPKSNVPESGRGSGLTPFKKGDPRAVAAGKKSAEARRQRAAVERAAKRKSIASLTALVDTYAGTELPPTAAAFVLHIMQMVVTGEIEVRNGAEAAALIDKAHTVYRLETGQSTSNAATLSLGADAVLSRLDEARQGIANPTPSDDAKGE